MLLRLRAKDGPTILPGGRARKRGLNGTGGGCGNEVWSKQSSGSGKSTSICGGVAARGECRVETGDSGSSSMGSGETTAGGGGGGGGEGAAGAADLPTIEENRSRIPADAIRPKGENGDTKSGRFVVVLLLLCVDEPLGVTLA